MNDLPTDFSRALEEAGLSSFFAACTPAHRREYLKWIGEAKLSATRQARIAKAVKMIAVKSAAERAQAMKAGRRAR